VGKHDEKKRLQRLDELNKNKALLLPRVGGGADDVEFRFVEWHSEVQVDREHIDEVSMPRGAKLMKEVVRDVVSDVLFYAESAHRDKILASIALQINALHYEFSSRHPASALNLHILAHSLGGVVAFDLLSSHYSKSSSHLPELAVDPQNLFICGSPLGLFLSIRSPSRGTSTVAENTHTRSMISPITGCLGQTRCRNIIHPLDVLSFRLEPLLEWPSSSIASASPEKRERSTWMHQPRDIPYYKGRPHTHKRLKNIGKLLSRSLSFGKAEAEDPGEPNAGGEAAAPSGMGFRQGLSSMLRRGLRRGEGRAGPANFNTGGEAFVQGQTSDTEPLCALGRTPDGRGTSPRPSETCEELGENNDSKGVESLPEEKASASDIRVDFKLQRSAAESVSEFITTIRSHRCFVFFSASCTVTRAHAHPHRRTISSFSAKFCRAYWHSKDFLLFVLHCTLRGRENTEGDTANLKSPSILSTCSEEADASPKIDLDEDDDDGLAASLGDLSDD
jgi:hypothetical protein